MFQSKFNRLIVAGLATAAIVPTAAVARVADDPAAAPQTQQQDLRAPDQAAPITEAPGTGVVQDLRAPDQVGGGVEAVPAGPAAQDLRAPDQVDGSPVAKVVPGLPTWPVNPQPITTAAPANATSDDGIDDTVLIALGGGALLLVAGIGIAGRKRLRVVRQRQLA